MKKLFIDTGIVVELLRDQKHFSESSAILFNYAEKGKIKLFISVIGITEIYKILKETFDDEKIEYILSDIMNLMTILDLTEKIITKSLNNLTGEDLFLCIQNYTAESEEGISMIVTRDTERFKNFDIAAFTPEEALRIIDGM